MESIVSLPLQFLFLWSVPPNSNRHFCLIFFSRSKNNSTYCSTKMPDALLLCFNSFLSAHYKRHTLTFSAATNLFVPDSFSIHSSATQSIHPPTWSSISPTTTTTTMAFFPLSQSTVRKKLTWITRLSHKWNSFNAKPYNSFVYCCFVVIAGLVICLGYLNAGQWIFENGLSFFLWFILN